MAEIIIPFHGADRLTALAEEKEMDILGEALCFQENNTNLIKVGIQDLVQTFVLSIITKGKKSIGFCDGQPTLGWLNGFICEHYLQYKPITLMEVESFGVLKPSE